MASVKSAQRQPSPQELLAQAFGMSPGMFGGKLPGMAEANFDGPIDPEKEARKRGYTAAGNESESGKQGAAIQTEEWRKALSNVENYPPQSLRDLRKNTKNLWKGLGAAVIGESTRAPYSLLDLSPLAGLNDSWFGTNLAKSYNGPPADKTIAQASKLAQVISQMENTLSQEESSLLKAQITDYMMQKYGINGGVSNTVSEGAPANQGLSAGQILGEQRAQRHENIAAENRAEDKNDAAHQRVTNFIQKRADGGISTVYNSMKQLEQLMSANREVGFRRIPGTDKYMRKWDADSLLTGDEDSRTFWGVADTISQGIMREEIGSQRTRPEIQAIAGRLKTGQFDGPVQFSQAMKRLADLIGQSEKDKVNAFNPQTELPIYKSKDVTKFEDEFPRFKFNYGGGGSGGDPLLEKLKKARGK